MSQRDSAINPPVEAYEQVPYGSQSYPEAHPDRLYVVGRLFGLSPPPVEGARILELGCGAGMHLAPIAARNPDSRCVGLDRSPSAIASARALAERLGAPNVSFLEADLGAPGDPLAGSDLPGQYDYVVVHGVYSWVSDEVRDALLARCGAALAPDGIAYVSYNVLPGWHVRGMVAEMMRFHASGFDSPQKQIAQARALLRFLAEAVPESDPYGAWLRREERLVAAQPDAWVFHDLLADNNRAVSVHAFVEHARAHGLAYLGDADVPSMLPDRLPESVRRSLDALGSDAVRSEQYLDFVLCRNFRRSLLCRPEQPVDRRLSWERLEGLALRGALTVVGQDGAGGEVFRTRSGDTLSTTVPLLRAALRILGARAPEPVGFDELAEQAMAAAGTGDRAADRALIGRNLLVCFARGVVDVAARGGGVAHAPGERPLADPVVRALAADGTAVPSLLHERVSIEPIDQSLLPRLDGTRTAAALTAELFEEFGASVPDEQSRERLLAFLRGAVPDRLATYADSALLAG